MPDRLFGSLFDDAPDWVDLGPLFTDDFGLFELLLPWDTRGP